LHPSNSGIAHHLGFHRFELASNIEIAGARAEGSVLPILRDENYVIEEKPHARDSQGPATIASRWERMRRNLGVARQRVTRDPARIALARTAHGWKIDEAPLR
jgi:hypothetical protein